MSQPTADAPSWRDSTSASAQQDLDEIMSAGVEYAEDQLSKSGELYPFAMAKSLGGETILMSADPEALDDMPFPSDVRAQLIAQLFAGRDRCRALAIVCDVTLDDGQTDAIQVELEHAEHTALTVHARYRRDGNGVAIGALSVSPGQTLVWS